MEDQTILDDRGGEKLFVTETAKNYLTQSAKWAKFLAIVGFVIVGFMVLLGLFFGTFMGMMSSSLGSAESSAIEAMGAGAFGLIYVLLALLYFMPTLYLYRFSTRTKRALIDDNSEMLTDALGQLKSMFTFMGILTLIFVIIYGAIFLFGLLFAGIGLAG